MNAVTLKSTGQILDRGEVFQGDPLVYLGYKAELEDGFTLRSWFRILENYPLLIGLNVFYPAYMERYRESTDSDCVYGDFDHLELAKTVEMIGFPGKPRLEIYLSFYGVSGEETREIKFIQWEHLLDMPVKLGRLKHIVFGDNVDVLGFETVYTLFEFIDGIGWELGFHATPMQCDLRR
jgi:hypothetical protein